MMKTNRCDIVVVGSSNTDMIVKSPRIPKPGETIVGGKFSVAAGGKGANQAVAAARAGGSVSFISRVGNDMFGKKAINGFKDDSIDVKYVYKDKTAASGIALIMVGENGQNSISVALGANLCLSPADIQKASRLITSAKILVLQLEIPLESVQAAIEIAHKNGVRVILNHAPAQPLDHELLCKVSILTPNESEAEILTGIATNDEPSMNAVADKLMTFGIETVLLTLGARGVFCATKTERTLIPAFTVEPVDTTAAGDVFNGALAVALAKKKSLTESVRFANAAAAISVTRLGAQPSAPYKKEIDKFLKERS